MTYVGRLGGMLRQSLAGRLNPGSNGAGACLSAVYILSRGMASSRLFVGGLSWGTSEEALRDAFASYGDLTEVRIINDRDTGRSRGFGFITFSSDTDAEAALKAMDGQDLGGRVIRVNYATSPGSGSRLGGPTRGFGFGGSSVPFGGGFSGDEAGSGSLGNEGGFGHSPGKFDREQGGFGRGSAGFGSEQSGFGRSSGELNFEHFGKNSEGFESKQGVDHSFGGFGNEQGSFGHSPHTFQNRGVDQSSDRLVGHEGSSFGSKPGVFGGQSGSFDRNSESVGDPGFSYTSRVGTEGSSVNKSGMFGRSPETSVAEAHSFTGMSKEGGGGFGRNVGGFGAESNSSGEPVTGFGRSTGGFGIEPAAGHTSGKFGSEGKFGGEGIDSQKSLGLEGGSFGSSAGFLNSENKGFGESLGSSEFGSTADSWSGLNRISGGFSNKARRMRRAAGLTMNSESTSDSWKNLDSSYGNLFNATSDSSESKSKLGSDFWKDLDLSNKTSSFAGTNEQIADTTSSSGLNFQATTAASSDDWRRVLGDSSTDAGGLRSTTRDTTLETVSRPQSVSSSFEDWRRSLDEGMSVASDTKLSDGCSALRREDSSKDGSTTVGGLDKDKISSPDDWRNM